MRSYRAVHNVLPTPGPHGCTNAKIGLWGFLDKDLTAQQESLYFILHQPLHPFSNRRSRHFLLRFSDSVCKKCMDLLQFLDQNKCLAFLVIKLEKFTY